MLTLQYVPYSEIADLGPQERIRKLLRIVRENKIVLMEGRLTPKEETKLIEITMEQINKTFKGIEICTVYPDKKSSKPLFDKLREEFYSLLLGDKQGLTIIGPATIVKEIRKNPTKIELFINSKKGRR